MQFPDVCCSLSRNETKCELHGSNRKCSYYEADYPPLPKSKRQSKTEQMHVLPVFRHVGSPVEAERDSGLKLSVRCGSKPDSGLVLWRSAWSGVFFQGEPQTQAMITCRDGHSTHYLRAAALLRDFVSSRADSSVCHLMVPLSESSDAKSGRLVKIAIRKATRSSIPNCRSRAGMNRW